MANKNLTNFLLYSYFGLTEDSTKEEKILAAVNRAYIDTASHVLHIPNGNEAFREKGTGEIIKAIEEYDKSEQTFSKWHETICNTLTDRKFNVTYGIAQKWVNMTMKYLWLLDELPEGVKSEDLHIPIDRYIIDALWEYDCIELPIKKGNRSYLYKNPSDYVAPWSEWNNYKSYNALQEQAKSVIINKFNISPIEWESKAWIKVAKKHATQKD